MTKDSIFLNKKHQATWPGMAGFFQKKVKVLNANLGEGEFFFSV